MCRYINRSNDNYLQIYMCLRWSVATTNSLYYLLILTMWIVIRTLPLDWIPQKQMFRMLKTLKIFIIRSREIPLKLELMIHENDCNALQFIARPQGKNGATTQLLLNRISIFFVTKSDLRYKFSNHSSLNGVIMIRRDTDMMETTANWLLCIYEELSYC